MLFGHQYVFFGDTWEISIALPSIFLTGLFVFLVLSYMNSLYMLAINPLWVALFAIFSPTLRILFVLFMVSFSVQNLLSLIGSPLFIFVLMFITLEGGCKKILL